MRARVARTSCARQSDMMPWTSIAHHRVMVVYHSVSTQIVDAASLFRSRTTSITGRKSCISKACRWAWCRGANSDTVDIAFQCAQALNCHATTTCVSQLSQNKEVAVGDHLAKDFHLRNQGSQNGRLGCNLKMPKQEVWKREVLLQRHRYTHGWYICAIYMGRLSCVYVVDVNDVCPCTWICLAYPGDFHVCIHARNAFEIYTVWDTVAGCWRVIAWSVIGATLMLSSAKCIMLQHTIDAFNTLHWMHLGSVSRKDFGTAGVEWSIARYMSLYESIQTVPRIWLKHLGYGARCGSVMMRMHDLAQFLKVAEVYINAHELRSFACTRAHICFKLSRTRRTISHGRARNISVSYAVVIHMTIAQCVGRRCCQMLSS